MALPLIAAGVGLYKFFTGIGFVKTIKKTLTALFPSLLKMAGFGILAYTGIDFVLDTAIDRIYDYANGGNISGFPQAVTLMTIMRIPDATSLILSSYVTALTYKTLYMGTNIMGRRSHRINGVF